MWENEEKKIPLFSKKEKIGAGASALVGLVLALVFWQFSLNIFKPKKINVPLLTIPVSEFKERTGAFGSQLYSVSVHTHVYEGNKRLIPTPGCRDIMIVDLKFKEKNIDVVKKNLLPLEGISKVDVFPNKIIINRFCSSATDLPELWKWEDVWKNVESTLNKYFSVK